ncbi:MAG: hypothetical protein WKF37_02235 [Bryobacteraceae bacterium]
MGKASPLQAIEDFRQDARYAGDGNRVDFAYAMRGKAWIGGSGGGDRNTGPEPQGKQLRGIYD